MKRVWSFKSCSCVTGFLRDDFNAGWYCSLIFNMFGEHETLGYKGTKNSDLR